MTLMTRINADKEICENPCNPRNPCAIMQCRRYKRLKMTKRDLPFILVLIMLTSSLLLAENSFSINGYYKNFITVLNSPIQGQETISTLNNRLRLKLFYTPSDWFSFTAAYDFSLRVQYPSLFEKSPIMADIAPYGYRIEDFNSRIYPSDNDSVSKFGIFHNLDRVLLTFNTSIFDLYIGRQAIAWGSARVVNPTDVITPFSLEALDTEERVGVDAVRARFPLGLMGEYDIGYIWGEKSEFAKSAYFHRCKLYWLETDFSILMMVFRRNFLAGFDITRAIGKAGFWFEGAYVLSQALDSYEEKEGKNYFRSSIGVDYSFSGRPYGFLEYHFSEAGTNAPEDYLTNLSSSAYTDGAVYLMGRDYLAPGLMYQITPLINFSGQGLFNLADGSIFLSPGVEYNIAQDIYISAGAYVGIGKSPEESPIIKFRSEFGTYPDIYFSSFRVYF